MWQNEHYARTVNLCYIFLAPVYVFVAKNNLYCVANALMESLLRKVDLRYFFQAMLCKTRV